MTFSLSVSRMDPALLRQGELFKKRALSTPAVEKRPRSSDPGSHKKKQSAVDVGSSSESNLSAGKWGLYLSIKLVISILHARFHVFLMSTCGAVVTSSRPSLGWMATKLKGTTGNFRHGSVFALLYPWGSVWTCAKCKTSLKKITNIAYVITTYVLTTLLVCYC